MRKPLDRLRRWLIRKLGGFTEQKILPPPHYHQANIQVRIMQAAYRVGHWRELTGDRKKMLEWCEERLAVEIGRELIASRAIVLECADGLDHPDMILRARVFLVDGKDAALYINRPLREVGL